MTIQTQILAILIVCDVVFGSLSAWINKCFNSQAMKRGLITHSLVLIILMFVSANAKYLKGYSDIITWMEYTFIMMYAISLLETYMVNGGTIPDSVKSRFDLDNKIKTKKKTDLDSYKQLKQEQQEDKQERKVIDKWTFKN